MRDARSVDAWLQILEGGNVKVFSGKVELGQGIRTAIRQVAAEELNMPLKMVEVHLAETGVTPNEGYTAGSASIKNSAMSVRYAAATARRELLRLAAERWGVSPDDCTLSGGKIQSRNSGDTVGFGELLQGQQIETEVTTPVPLKNKGDYQYVGKAIPRDDIEQMVRAEPIYIQDLRFPGMVHARVVRPPNYQAQLISVDITRLEEAAPAVIKTVVNGNFVGIIAEREYEAIKAEQVLGTVCDWSVSEDFPDSDRLYDHIRSTAVAPEIVRDDGDVGSAFEGKETIKSIYTKPYTKHGSMGPACAIALYEGDTLHVWSHSQGVYPLRAALAAMLSMEVEKVHVIGVPGAGCYGHSTADDAAADASLLAIAYPGKHVRVQWSRSDEYAWDPYGSAIIGELEASLDANGRIAAWKSDIWTDSHSTRPNSDPATLLAARHVENPTPLTSRGYLGGGHRNGDPYYSIPNFQLNAHFFDGPLRVSSLRSLGAYANIFVIESFMDELAEKAGTDPIDFRLAHLGDDRAKAVISKVREMTEGQEIGTGQGIGYGFVRYKNNDGYAAVAAHVSVDKGTGNITLLKLWGAVDVGEVINLDGIRNQMEGGMLQAASWTLRRKSPLTGSALLVPTGRRIRCLDSQTFRR